MRPTLRTESPRRTWLLAACTAALVALQGCSTAPSRPAGSAALTERSEQSALRGRDVALYAMAMLDRDYRWGGRQPESGFDCSGLVRHVFREAVGLDLHGNSAALSRLSRPVDSGALQAGDLLFFNTLGQPSSHVGVYVGQGQFVHAANERSGVRISRLSERYYAARFEGAKSVLD
jgi:cell wall-associated NlpC family hydrolase